MSVYQQSPQNKHLEQAVPGIPAYLLGSFNYNVASTGFRVSTVQLTSPTATVVGTVTSGNIPVVGQTISFSGVVPSYFNVTNAPILSVSAAATPDVGVYTITFSLTNSNIATTVSPGRGTALPPETAEALSAYGGSVTATRAISLQSNTGPNNGRSIRFDASFPVQAGSVTLTAQSAVRDVDSAYQDLGSIATLTGGTLTGGSAIFTDIVAEFVRVRVSGLAGVSTTTAVVTVTI